MIKDVIINIKGTQGIDEQKDTVELTTVGRYGIKDGSYFMTYDESEMIGAKGVKTMLRIKDDDTVVLQRSGTMQSRLTVQKGIRNTCFYNTIQGELIIGIFGEIIKNDLTSNGGKLYMSYTVDSNLKLISRNIVEISVKEVNNNVNACSTN